MKQSLTQKTLRFLIAPISACAAAFRKLRARLEASIPCGYEDENGFHSGDPGPKFHL